MSYLLVGGLEHFLFFHSVGNVIIPIDFRIFQRGRSSTNQTLYSCQTWDMAPSYHHHITIISPSYHHHITIILPSDYHHIPILLPSYSHLITIIFPSYYHHITIISPSYSHRIIIIFPSYYHHITIIFPSYSHPSQAVPLECHAECTAAMVTSWLSFWCFLQVFGWTDVLVSVTDTGSGGLRLAAGRSGELVTSCLEVSWTFQDYCGLLRIIVDDWRWLRIIVDYWRWLKIIVDCGSWFWWILIRNLYDVGLDILRHMFVLNTHVFFPYQTAPQKADLVFRSIHWGHLFWILKRGYLWLSRISVVYISIGTKKPYELHIWLQQNDS